MDPHISSTPAPLSSKKKDVINAIEEANRVDNRVHEKEIPGPVESRLLLFIHSVFATPWTAAH